MDTIDAIITAAYAAPATRTRLQAALTRQAQAHDEAADRTTRPEVERIARRMAQELDSAARAQPTFETTTFSQRILVFREACRVLEIPHAQALRLAQADDALRTTPVASFLQSLESLDA